MSKAVIIFSDVLNGIVFDTFEYFYRLWELDKSIKLISKYSIFTKDFHKKYNIDDNCFQNIIIDNPLNYKLTLALIFGTTHSQELNTNVNFPIWCVNNDNLKLKGITKYYGEYTDNKDYIIKLYYQIHKVFKHSSKTYINCLDHNNIEYLKLLLKYVTILPLAVTCFNSANIAVIYGVNHIFMVGMRASNRSINNNAHLLANYCIFTLHTIIVPI